MSKYTEALNLRETTDPLFITKAEREWLSKTIDEALKIADRLEQADAEDVHNRFCNKFHKRCYFKDGCKETGHKCEEAGGWEKGYNQALADIRNAEMK